MTAVWTLYERETTTRGEAFALVLSHANLGGMEWRATEPFAWAAPPAAVPHGRVGQLVRGEHGKGVSWREMRNWAFALPRVGYNRREQPCIAFDVQPYIVAAVLLKGRWPATVVGPAGKSSQAVLPLQVLLPFLKGKGMAPFPLMVRARPWTTFCIEGSKEGQVKYHDRFLDGLRDALDRETMARWLSRFGPQGEELTPLVADDLYALLESELSGMQERHPGWTHEELMASLRDPFGYSDSDARRLIALASPSPGIPLEEAVRACLRHAGDRRS